MNTKELIRSLLVCCAATVCGSVFAQSGLATRPINLTCTAPLTTALTLYTEASFVSSDTLLRAASGREGGVAYRGMNVPAIHGQFVFVQDKQLMVQVDSKHGVIEQQLELTQFAPVSIVEGVDSEIYLLDENDSVRLLKQTQPTAASAPASLLSQTGCFDASDPSIATVGLIPYEPAAPLWSDNAAKRRWIAMPDWNEADTQITVLADGDFEFPVGTILIKEFRLGAVIAETRLMIKDMTGAWAGYSYEWNDEQTDATLLSVGKSKTINGQQWDYPFPFECLFCHSQASNRVLGLEIAQLNRDFTYVDTSTTANQLTTLDSIGLIAGGLSAPVGDLDALPAYDDLSAPIDERARGYLHSNCANCHQPGGPGQGPEDFRYYLDGSQIGSNNVVPWLGDLGVEGARLLLRGSPELSIISIRMKNLSFNRMPPLGSNILDTQGVALIDQWIESGLGFGIGDIDADQKADDLDNCSEVANVSQLDADADGFGNACDADLNNDNIVNFLDLALFSSAFLSTDAVADFNGDGVVNFIDLPVLANAFFGPPGPSGLNP